MGVTSALLNGLEDFSVSEFDKDHARTLLKNANVKADNVFSPACSHYLTAQASSYPFGEKSCAMVWDWFKSEKKSSARLNLLDECKGTIFAGITLIHKAFVKNDNPIFQELKRNNKLRIYEEGNIGQVLKLAKKFVKKNTNNMIELPACVERMMLITARIYISTAYFSQNWRNKFGKEGKADFMLKENGDRDVVKRDYMSLDT